MCLYICNLHEILVFNPRRRLSHTGVKVPLTDVKVSASEDSSSTTLCETDVSKCFICQEDKDEKLMYTSVKKGVQGSQQ